MSNIVYEMEVKSLIDFLKITAAEAFAMVDVGITVESLKETYGDIPANWIKKLM
jgi:hypothetical protein